jgi:hypothetical protein
MNKVKDRDRERVRRRRWRLFEIQYIIIKALQG